MADKAKDVFMKPKEPKAPAYARRYLDNPTAERRRADDALLVAPKVPQPYPAWRYHETLGACIVQDEAADKSLGAGWSAAQTEVAPITYPSWRYHLAKDPVLVKSAAEAKGLGDDWYPSVAAAAATAK